MGGYLPASLSLGTAANGATLITSCPPSMSRCAAKPSPRDACQHGATGNGKLPSEPRELPASSSEAAAAGTAGAAASCCEVRPRMPRSSANCHAMAVNGLERAQPNRQTGTVFTLLYC
eukprot:363670-Chlamydomonas_euryale.AAC.18